MTRNKKHSFVATVTRDGANWCVRVLGLRDVFAQGHSLGATEERLRWVLAARLAADAHPPCDADVEITLIFSPTRHCQGCC